MLGKQPLVFIVLVLPALIRMKQRRASSGSFLNNPFHDQCGVACLGTVPHNLYQFMKKEAGVKYRSVNTEVYLFTPRIF